MLLKTYVCPRSAKIKETIKNKFGKKGFGSNTQTGHGKEYFINLHLMDKYFTGDNCIDACERRGQQYSWCHKETTLWGFCTPDFLIKRTARFAGM